MTTEFKAVTPQRAVEIMKAWAYHPWPMTVQDGIDVYTSLGFKGDPQDPEFFTSDMSPAKPDSYLVSTNGIIDECVLRLSSWISEEYWEKSLPEFRSRFSRYVDSFIDIAGSPLTVTDEGTDYSTRWILNHRNAVRLGGNEAFITLTIESPKQTGYLLDELEAEGNGEEIGADYF